MFGEVIADERQINVIDELIPHERTEHLRLEFIELQQGAFAGDSRLFQRVEGLEARDNFALVTGEAFVEIEVIEGVGPTLHAGVRSFHAGKREGGGGGDHTALEGIATEDQGAGFFVVAEVRLCAVLGSRKI